MNREIKFRAWDIQNERMVHQPYRFEKAWENELALNELALMDAPYYFYEDWQDIEDGIRRACQIMQYTGLKDKNGKEIYEEDVVKAWIDFGPAGEHLETFTVKLSPFGVNIQEWNYQEWNYKENRLPEIIGNIYENPELLKEKRI